MKNDGIGKSVLVPFVKGLINLFCLVSPYHICSRMLWRHHECIPFWYAEAYVVLRLFIVSIAFVLLKNPVSLAYSLFSVVCILMLLDLLAGTARIFFIEREDRKDAEGHFIVVRDVSRWVILVFLNLVEIVLYFSVLYFKLGDGFNKTISDRLTALYQSMLTFTTLGYGEIVPETNTAKLLVMCHLAYFIVFAFLVVPAVFSAVRVKVHTREILGDTRKEEEDTQQPPERDK